ncbi:MAG: GNAT family N-acetyltransferase [Mucilaginibacter sp.]
MNYSLEQFILSSDRLLFRQHIMADMDAYCAMEADPEVRRYVGGAPRSREDAERKFLNGAMQPATDRLAMWATVLKEDGRYIGRCGIYPHFKPEGGVFEGEGTLAFYIASDCWNHGYATEAGRSFVRFGFNELHLKTIVTTVQEGNSASIHILEKLGFDLASTEKGLRTFYHFALQNTNVI